MTNNLKRIKFRDRDITDLEDTLVGSIIHGVQFNPARDTMTLHTTTEFGYERIQLHLALPQAKVFDYQRGVVWSGMAGMELILDRRVVSVNHFVPDFVDNGYPIAPMPFYDATQVVSGLAITVEYPGIEECLTAYVVAYSVSLGGVSPDIGIVLENQSVDGLAGDFHKEL